MDLTGFAEQWISDWNSHDIERVLSHYKDDAELRSPNALKMTGQGLIRGREALRAYWAPALHLRLKLRVYLKQAFIGFQTISIYYGDELGRNVIETLVFEASGTSTFGCGCYA